MYSLFELVAPGSYPKHPDLVRDVTQFVLPDRVHLSEMGYSLFFLTQFKGVLNSLPHQKRLCISIQIRIGGVALGRYWPSSS